MRFTKKEFIIVSLIFGLCVCLCLVQAVFAAEELAPESQAFQTAKDPSTLFVDSPEVLKEIKRLEEKYPEKSVGQPKYERSGHQYTTFIVAREAGLNSERSYRLSYFSQLPDDEKEFSATLAFFYLFDLEYRKQIMGILHSLHGGDHNAVLKRRRDLKDLIYNGIKNKSLEDYQIGLLIHAFADAYSHTAVHNGKLKAFDYTWGHLFHGHKPDIIAYDPELYREYACELYKALSLESSCLPQLNDLFKMIKGLEISRNIELPKFETYAKATWFFNEDYYNLKSGKWDKSISKAEMQKTIEVIKAKIQSK